MTDRVLHRSAHCVVGLFELPPGHELWRDENRISSGPLIAIPWTAVEIDRSGARHELMDPNRIAYYRREQTYCRRVVSARGDRCLFIVPSDLLLHDALADAGLAPTDDGNYPFATGPAVSEATHAQHRLARALLMGVPLTSLEIDDSITRIVRLLLTQVARESGRRLKQKTGPSRVHRDIVARARTVMNAQLDDAVCTTSGDASLTINDIADRVDASPYHLSRVFREQTGDSLARHYRRLRLRVAAESVACTCAPLTDIALRFGFSSHAHFSAAWRTEFGSTPIALRRA